MRSDKGSIFKVSPTPPFEPKQRNFCEEQPSKKIKKISKQNYSYDSMAILKPSNSLKRMASRFISYSASIHSFHSHNQQSLALSSSFSLSRPSLLLYSRYFILDRVHVWVYISRLRILCNFL